MDDLRERLEALIQHLGSISASRTGLTPDDFSALREALDHPERLMGGLVAEITYSNWNGMDVEMTHHAAGKVPVGTKLYAKKVKQRQQVDAEHRICEHGRDAFADDCGMCDRAGTNYAKEVKL